MVQVARQLGFPCIGMPPVAYLCFGASSADHFLVGIFCCLEEERNFKTVLPGMAKPASRIHVRKEEVKGTCRGLGWLILKEAK